MEITGNTESQVQTTWNICAAIESGKTKNDIKMYIQQEVAATDVMITTNH